ncbi:hypothetical protein BDY21DRAFT_358195 [Lineolata rhizophorae]|uniref:Uncharacterized protein n=1 Tax=Lineolata rhizophorae TaxID=578093 RepID=A0A6A6NMP5_9PEZI|nr:hypothetical protein BDY21DRAFT_358195 [Lineolata rhizophorae]
MAALGRAGPVGVLLRRGCCVERGIGSGDGWGATDGRFGMGWGGFERLTFQSRVPARWLGECGFG